MVKSSQQCRAPKGPRRGGGLVVVNHRNLSRATSPGPPPNPNRKGKGKKKKKKGLSLGELMTSGDGEEGEDFDTPSAPRSPSASTGGLATYTFSSTHHSAGQRLYYLLATRPAPTQSAEIQQQSRGGGSVVTADGGAFAVEGGCHALVFVETAAVAQELVGELKALSLVAFALHDRTPKAQVQEHVKRFLAASSAERSSVLILTNSVLVRSPPSIGPVKSSQGSLLRVVHFDESEGEKNAAARARVTSRFSHGREAEAVEEVHLEGGADTAGLTPFSFDSAAMGGIRSRLAAAKKLSRAVGMSAGEGEERGMQRAAAAAGLEWDGDNGRSESAAEAAQREKRRAHAQQAAALRQKISVLLCQPLLSSPATTSAEGGSTSAPKTVQQSAKELRKKMAVLGMIHGPAPAAATAGKKGGVGAPEDRASAQTRWLDHSAGHVFGGSWTGSVRTGASCDSASKEVRARVEIAKQTRKGGASGKGGGAVDVATSALARWNPNPDTPDPDKWGGRWGKPCGHNEVVLQHLRPFAPMEVVNTRVCSKASPAPGNGGFDGCLEMLSLTCRAHERGLTIWDEASFVHIDKFGTCSSMPKQTMLHLSLPTLRFLMKNMRGFTVCGGGQKPPKEVARAVIRSAGWGTKQSKFGPLSVELSRRVMSFVLSGDPATWRSISAGLGMRGRVPQAAAAASGHTSPRDTLAFASKKKRKHFNL